MTSNVSEWFSECEDQSFILRVHIQPRASRNEITGIRENALRIRLTSPPVDGAANEACCWFLAKKLKIPASSLSIISGETSRHKRIRITGTSRDMVASLADNAV